MFSLTIVLIKFKTLKFETKPLKCFCHFQMPLNRACKVLPPHLTTLSPITGGLGHYTLFEQTELSSSSLDHRPSVHGTNPVNVILWRQNYLLSLCLPLVSTEHSKEISTTMGNAALPDTMQTQGL